MKSRMLTNNHGAAMVFLAVILVVLLSISALAIDLGKLYIAKQRAQNVADAAAEGGAANLTGEADCTDVDTSSGERTGGDGPAAGAAKDIAKANNDAFSEGFWQVLHPDNHSRGVLVSFPPDAETPNPIQGADGKPYNIVPGSAITVKAAVPVEFGFAKIMGFTGTRYVTASATAVLVSSGYYINDPMPFTTPEEMLTMEPDAAGKEYDLTYHNWTNTDYPVAPGNFSHVLFDGDNNNPEFLARISGDGSRPPVEVTDPMYVRAYGGSEGNPIKKALDERLAGSNLTYDEWVEAGYPDTPQLVLVPIIKSGFYHNNDAIQVVGFSAFFIEPYGYDKKSIKGRFLQAITLGDLINGTDNPFFDTTPKEWTKGVKLIK